MKMNASKPVPDDKKEATEEAMPENKLILDNLTERIWLFKTAIDFFYNMDLSSILALKLKQTMVLYRNSL